MDAVMKVSKFTQTYSGGKFYPRTPRGEDMDIADIAMALSKQCRFNGHCEGFYSVAQHAVLVSHRVPEWCAREGLMHDAAEAWIGDLVTPVKYECPDYLSIEEGVEVVVARRFGLVYPLPAAVKKADRRICATEKRDLFGACQWAETQRVDPYPDITITPLEWQDAYVLFRERAEELGVS